MIFSNHNLYLRRKQNHFYRTQNIIVCLSTRLVDVSFIKRSLYYLNQDEYNDAINERSDKLICGYFLCHKDIKLIKNKFRVDQNETYSIEVRCRFCSDWCYAASNFLKCQLENEEIWMKNKIKHKEIEFYPKDGEGCKGELIESKKLDYQPLDSELISQMKSLTVEDENMSDKNKKKYQKKPSRKIIFIDECIAVNDYNMNNYRDPVIDCSILNKVMENINSWIYDDGDELLKVISGGKLNNPDTAQMSVDDNDEFNVLQSDMPLTLRRIVIINSLKRSCRQILQVHKVPHGFFDILFRFLYECDLQPYNVDFNSKQSQCLTVVLINMFYFNSGYGDTTNGSSIDYFAEYVHNSCLADAQHYREAVTELFQRIKLIK